ncbi:neurobeachin-like protein 1 [Hetaerina americana]|uniref:neurobeachin-like protein 1 n=1 Tax=Hetaerina americana TaxID=62018 RepID=UPI003A7F1D90
MTGWSADGVPKERHWKLSRHENSSRMRLKFCPNLDFSLHTEASNLRDNSANIKRNSVGWVTRIHTDDIPHTMTISAAVCPESEEESTADEDLRALADLDLEGVKESGKEKMVISQECDLVTLMSVVKGRLEVTTAHISFTDLSPVKEDVERQDFKMSISRLKDMYPRRYNLRRSAIEFFLTDQTNYFLNFSTKVRNKVYSSILSLRPPNLSTHHARSPADLLKASGLTQKWVTREINNFDYLMQLNTVAGRTYNDLSQYPVFPWILADYTSEKLDLDNPESFRDLSKPIGVVNPKNEEEVKAKFDSFEDPSGTIAKFHYGTHYSNSAGVLHYLVRVEPFTTLHIELQSGRFDVADRQFHSIPQTWKLLMDNPNDVKELIPEFFYMPEFLTNHNGFDLGHLQGSKEQVNDVTLPKWASSPVDFIHKHRDALESEYVSAHLHEWIDLIFGFKQKGPKAVEALNVFYYCSYEGAVDLDAIANPFEREAVEGMINNFGQTPSQLLHGPHPKRLPLGEALQRTLTRRPDLSLYLERICSVPVLVSNESDPLVFVSTPRSPPRGSFLQTTLPDNVVTVTRSGIIGVHSWVPHGTSSSNLSFNFDVDPSINSTKYRKKLPSTFHPGLTLSSQMFAVSNDGKLLYSVGHWDSSLHVYSLSRNKTIAHAIRHFDIVTCVALDECGSYLITGSRDTTCVVWDISGFGVGGNMGAGSSGSIDMGAGGPFGGGSSSNMGQSTGISGAALVPVHTLHGHDAPVTCVAILTQLDIAASGSMDGTVNVYTIQEGQYIRTLPAVECIENIIQEIAYIAISNHGHIAFATRQKVNTFHFLVHASEDPYAYNF